MIHSKYTYISQALGLNKNIGTGNGPAYLTHYWQTWPEPISKLFLSEAERFLGSFVNSQEFTLNLPLEFDVPFPPPPNPKFSFIDLFAGIGGISGGAPVGPALAVPGVIPGLPGLSNSYTPWQG